MYILSGRGFCILWCVVMLAGIYSIAFLGGLLRCSYSCSMDILDVDADLWM